MVEAQYVDFHCHLDLYPSMEEAYAKCGASGCETLAVTTTPKAFPKNQLLAREFDNIHVALGLHPQAVASRAFEVSELEAQIKSTQFIGEIGLDAGRAHYSSFVDQKVIFSRILRACVRYGEKTLSIHSVRCAKHVLDEIERSEVYRNCNIVLHWFSASKSEIRRAIELGCLFSANNALLNSPPGGRLLSLVPRTSILTETDGPFIAVRGEPVRPGMVDETLDILARQYSVSPSEAKIIIFENVSRLLRG